MGVEEGSLPTLSFRREMRQGIRTLAWGSSDLGLHLGEAASTPVQAQEHLPTEGPPRPP